MAEAEVLELRVQGRTIGTTTEHPFFVRGKGWTKAQDLRPGDELRLESPGWLPVEVVEHTGRVETVYNVAVEDDHTYFVGDDDWGWAVWAHNACEKHHPGFKYILRGLNQWKNGTTSLKKLGQTTIKIDGKVHRKLHEAFDTTYSKFRRQDGWRNIAAQLDMGTTTPAKLFDAMEDVTRQFLKGPQLQQALGELAQLRKLF